MKLADYELRRLGQQAVDFFDDMQNIVNYGKYAFPIVAAVPAWAADNGEMAFYDGVAQGTLAAKRIYVRLSSSWEVFATSPFPVGATPGDGEGAIQFNSSNAFGGEPQFKWNQTTSSLVINNAINGTTALWVTSGSNVGIHMFDIGFGTGARGVLLFGNGTLPANATDAVQMLGRSVGGGNTDLHIVPEVGGPHIIGQAVVFSSATVTVRNDVGGAALICEGSEQVNGPAGITLQDVSTANAIQMNWVPINTVYPSGGQQGLAQGPSLDINIDDVVQHGFIQFSRDDPVGITGEVPLVRFTPAILKTNSATSITNWRYIQAYTPNYQTAGTGTTVTNAATVYIQGAPAADGGGITLSNRYALWVDDGNVRIDGTVVSGAATTELRGSGVIFTTTALGVSSNNTADTTLIRGIVGTTSLVANTLSEGRTIRLQAWGYYNTPTTAGTAIMNVKIGGTAILTTSNRTVTSSASTLGWRLDSIITCQTTGGAGTVFAQGRFDPQSSAIASDFWQLATGATAIINTTGANVVEVSWQWGTANAANQLVMSNCVGELLN